MYLIYYFVHTTRYLNQRVHAKRIGSAWYRVFRIKNCGPRGQTTLSIFINYYHQQYFETCGVFNYFSYELFATHEYRVQPFTRRRGTQNKHLTTILYYIGLIGITQTLIIITVTIIGILITIITRHDGWPNDTVF